MRIYEGMVRETQLQGGIGRTAWIECPKAAIPAPGRYVMAWSPEEADAPLATPLFAARIEAGGFQAASPIPGGWEPGTRLQLRGPLGKGLHSAGKPAPAGAGRPGARASPACSR